MCGMKPVSMVSFGRSLPRLLLESGCDGELLNGLATVVAQAVSANSSTPVDCAIFLRQPKRAVPYGASSLEARTVGRLEQESGYGPCSEALLRGITVIEVNLLAGTRWPTMTEGFRDARYHSVLCVPVELPSGAAAVFALFSRDAENFDAAFFAVVDEAVAECSDILQLTVKHLAMQHHIQDLTAAMETRSVIDTACGVIMAQNRCSHEAAFELLIKASNNRNEKLHAVALRILRCSSATVGTHQFDP